MISIKIVGLEEVARKVNVNLKPALRASTFAIGEEIRNNLTKYPPRRHDPVKWTSRKQRIYYFAMRRKKGLPLGYTRGNDPMSQRLGASWATAHKGDTDAVVGTRVKYARWVQSDKDQQPMHKETGWITDKQAIEKFKSSGKAGRIVRDAIMHAVR